MCGGGGGMIYQNVSVGVRPPLLLPLPITPIYTRLIRLCVIIVLKKISKARTFKKDARACWKFQLSVFFFCNEFSSRGLIVSCSKIFRISDKYPIK